MATKQKRSLGKRLNEKGLEILSNLKKSVHIKPRRPVSDHQRFRQWLDAASKQAALKGEDTYEEFTDFGVDEETIDTTQYELVFDPISGKEVLPAEKMWLDKQRAAWELQEREKRKAERQKKQLEETVEHYVTKKAEPSIPKPSKKPPNPKNDDWE